MPLGNRRTADDGEQRTAKTWYEAVGPTTLAQAISLLTCITKLPASNLGRDTDYTN